MTDEVYIHFQSFTWQQFGSAYALSRSPSLRPLTAAELQFAEEVSEQEKSSHGTNPSNGDQIGRD